MSMQNAEYYNFWTLSREARKFKRPNNITDVDFELLKRTCNSDLLMQRTLELESYVRNLKDGNDGCLPLRDTLG